jgi:hypothetical protein
MTGPDDGAQRVERVLESALGSLSDWLELVRLHENERRIRIAAEEQIRRDHHTTAAMAVLSAAVLAFFFWLNHR